MEPRQSGGHSLAAPSRRRRHEWWQASERHALKIHLLPSKRPQGFAPKHATAQECNARGLIVAFLLLAFDRQIDLGSPRTPPHDGMLPDCTELRRERRTHIAAVAGDQAPREQVIAIVLL